MDSNDGKSVRLPQKLVSYTTTISKFLQLTELLIFTSLRTSDLHYLNESFAFFSAIRTRDYYSKANKEEKPDLMIKKLRYYARFILVCLLLGKMKLANELIRVCYLFNLTVKFRNFLSKLMSISIFMTLMIIWDGSR